MKIAGLTWWRNNYGSILQAYALQSELTKNKDVKYEILCQYGKSIQSFDNLIDKIKTKGVFNTVNRIFWKFILPGVNKRNQNIQKFVDENLNISSKQYSKDDIKEANKRYDIFVCGSDQIWNLTLESTDSIYWLGFVDENKIKFSYAPSIGVDSVNNEDAKQIKKNLESFNGISCREETGTNLINKILGVEKCVTVIDPTL